MNADPRIAALPDIHGHAKGEHKLFAEERPIPYTARMLFLWFYHACKRNSPRFLMVADHINYLTFEDPAAVNLVRRALKLAQAGDLYGAAETAGVELGHAAAVSEGLRRGMRYSIGAEVDNDPRSRPDAQNIVDAMRPDGMVRSVHFLPIAHPQHGENWMWPFDNAEFIEFYDAVGTETVWELYMATLLDAIDKLPGHIVGHFYVPAKFGHWPDEAKLESYEDRLIDACAERGMAIEINSRYFYKYYPDGDAQIERYRQAYLRLLRKAKAKGVMVAVGSDAHSPRDQGGAFDMVLALLDEADVNEIAFPINGRLARVALRATEEILRQHSAAMSSLPSPERVAIADGDEDESEDGEVAAAPVAVPVAANAAGPATRPRAKAKARPAAGHASAATGTDGSTNGATGSPTGAAAVTNAPAPTAARSRPSKKAPPPEAAAAPEADDQAPELPAEADTQSPKPEAGSAPKTSGAAAPLATKQDESPPAEAVTEALAEPVVEPAAEPQPESPQAEATAGDDADSQEQPEPGPAPAAEPEAASGSSEPEPEATAYEPVVAAAERIVSAVAESAKRATTALVDAAGSLLQGKRPPAPAGRRERPEKKTPAKRAAEAPQPSKAAKPPAKPRAKTGAKPKPGSKLAAKSAGKAASKHPKTPATAAKKKSPAKAAPAKTAKKPAAKKATASRASAKKTAPPAHRGAAAKAVKRPTAVKRSAPKKAPKKVTAKKKPVRSRR